MQLFIRLFDTLYALGSLVGKEIALLLTSISCLCARQLRRLLSPWICLSSHGNGIQSYPRLAATPSRHESGFTNCLFLDFLWPASSMVPLVHFPSSELLTLGTNNAKSLLNFAPSFARVFAKISRFGWADYIIFGKWRWPVLQASFQDHVLPTPFSLQVADWRLVPPCPFSEPISNFDVTPFVVFHSAQRTCITNLVQGSLRGCSFRYLLAWSCDVCAISPIVWVSSP